MYKVIKAFHDMQDNNYFYDEGKEYPRKGVNVLPSRLKELAGSKNRMGEPLIVEIIDEKAEEPTSKTAKKTKKTDK